MAKKIGWLEFAIGIFVVMVGLVIGIFFIRKNDMVEQVSLSQYLLGLISLLKNNRYDAGMAFVELFKSDFLFLGAGIVALFFLPATILPLLILFGKSFSLGFMLSYFIKVYALRGWLMGSLLLLPRYLLDIPCYLLVVAILLRNVYEKGICKRHYQARQVREFNYTIMLLALLLMIVSSLLEAYLIPKIFLSCFG